MEDVTPVILGFLASFAILVISMILTSAFMGGVEFGAVHVVLLKAIPVFVAVNLVALLPYGFFLTLPVWWAGLMIVFRLDFWEARTLVVVNWVLNILVHLLLFTLLR